MTDLLTMITTKFKDQWYPYIKVIYSNYFHTFPGVTSTETLFLEISMISRKPENNQTVGKCDFLFVSLL